MVSSSNDIRVPDNYAPNNPFFWNWYILIVEFNEVIKLIYRNDYLTFYNKMDQRENLGDM